MTPTKRGRTRAGTLHPRDDRVEAALERALAHLEDGLHGVEEQIAADASRATAIAAFHRLLAVTATSSAELPRALAGAASSAPPHPRAPRPANSIGSPSVGGGPGAAPAVPQGPSATGFMGRLEGIAARLHALVATIAERIGATSYDIGLSFPAGISISVSFDLPKVSTSSSPGPAPRAP